MILDGEDGKSRVSHALDGPIVQIDMGKLYVAARDGIDVDRKTMILGRDLDLPRVQFLDRMVRPMVAEFELVRPPPEGQPQNLMPETDPENRFFPNQLCGRLDQVRKPLGVPRSVAQEDAIRVKGQDLAGGRCGWDHHDVTPDAHQLAEDVVFDPTVDRYHPVATDDRRPLTEEIQLHLLPFLTVIEIAMT